MIYEDELPEDITDAEYALWFSLSVVDGVRIGPSIESVRNTLDRVNMTKTKRHAGRPPLPPERKMRRRPIGMLESDWHKAARLAKREGVSVDEIIRRLVRATPGAGRVYAEHGGRDE